MTIKSKFLLVFILIVILASIFGFQLLKADDLANQQRERYLFSNRQIILALDLKGRLVLAIKDVADSLTLGKNELEEYQQAKKFINRIVQDLTETTSKEETFSQSHDNDNRKEEVEKIIKLKIQIEKLLKDIDNLIETKIIENKPISEELFEKYFEEQFDRSLVLQIDEFIQEEREELNEINESALKESQKVKTFTYWLWLVSFLTFLVIFTAFYRSLATPLTQLRQAAENIGEKNYSFNLKIKPTNELGAVAQAFQIMERKIKANFQNIESLFELIVENSNDAIVTIDLEGNIISWNLGAEKIYGYSFEEVKGKSISLLAPDELKNEFKKVIKKIKEENAMFQIETKRVAKDGRVLDIDLNINPIIDHNSKCIGISSISKNITEIKNYQNSLIKAKNEAETANKAKSEFLSRMSHEFRTPLNSILGFCQILRVETNQSLTENQKEKFEAIINSGNHILKLVNGLLDLTAIEKGQLPINLKEVSINKLFEGAFEEIKEYAIEKKIRIIDNIPPNKEVWVTADQFQLKKVLLNLLTNAAKYNCENGSISISITVIEPKTALLTITDTGVGISEEKQSQIFKPFNAITPTASFEEGVGLGLSVSKVLIEMMNGKIYFESQLGKGSSFSIEIPFVREETVSEENANIKSSSIKNFNATIEKETFDEINLSELSIPGKLRNELLHAAEIYNYTKMESLINDLSSYNEDGKLIANITRKYLLQYNVEKIIETLNKTNRIT